MTCFLVLDLLTIISISGVQESSYFLSQRLVGTRITDEIDQSLDDMNESDEFKRRSILTVFQGSARVIQVAPEPGEAFYDESYLPPYGRNISDFASSLIYFPKLYESSLASGFNSKIERVAFPVEMGKNLQGKLSGNQIGIANNRKILRESNNDSFLSCIRPFLYLAQTFGLIPVIGISGTNAESLKFKWLHWKVAYTAIVMVGIGFIFCCSLAWSLSFGFSYDKSAPLVFYGCGVAGYFLFFDLARHWDSLSRGFEATEFVLIDYGYPHGQRRRFLVITVVFTFCGLVEHVLSLVVGFMKFSSCSNDQYDAGHFLHLYFLAQYSQVFSLVNYHHALGMLVFMFNFLATCCWNFTDLFLGLMGMALSRRLRQINKRLISVRGENKPSLYWRKIREEFNAMSVLVKNVDSDIQKLMLLSLGSNLFFICLQLSNSLKRRINAQQVVYFFWSFGFLILRTCFVTLCAAGVYDHSKESKTVLFSVPHQSYCHEVRRFLTQLCTDELSLTGCRFFSVTRGLILTIAGTVVTYEIVLVQFKTGIDEDEWAFEQNKTNCAISI